VKQTIYSVNLFYCFSDNGAFRNSNGLSQTISDKFPFVTSTHKHTRFSPAGFSSYGDIGNSNSSRYTWTVSLVEAANAFFCVCVLSSM
jgi:hypothetical protein